MFVCVYMNERKTEGEREGGVKGWEKGGRERERDGRD